MADRIQINFTANTSEVDQGAKKLSGGMTDVQKSLDKVGDAGTSAGKDVSRGLEDAQKSAKSAGTAIETNVGGGLSKAKDIGSGALDGLKSGLLGIAGLGSSIGDIVGTGVSALFGYIQEISEAPAKAIAELKKQIDDMYKDAADEGRTFLSDAQVEAAAAAILFDPDKRKKAADDAKQIGVDVNTYVLSQAGSYKDLQAVVEATKKAEDERAAAIAGRRQSQFGDPELVSLGKIQAANEALIKQHDDDAAAAVQTQAIKDRLADREVTSQQKVAAATQQRARDEQAALDGIKAPTIVVAPPDLSGVTKAIDDFVKKPRTVSLEVIGVGRFGNKLI